MSTISDIPITVDNGTSPSGHPVLRALLQEIETLLHNLAETGTGGSVDLRSLPLFPGDYQVLQDSLGQGEIQVMLNSLGPSTIYETAVPGVWWITHRNEAEEVVAEFIEVTRCPAILQTPAEELPQAIAQLRDLDQQLSET
ncbi:MAG: hydrogenase expression/formation C-terminal domain-containing protein [Gammaproteobacteria bacterium]